jgi:hypothetical protein
MDCTDIKALLSALVDDEIDTERRHLAERHLAGCRACRQLVDETERLGSLIGAEAEALAGGGILPPGFEGAVLGRTVHARPPRGYFHQWTSWAGWLAAAASLVLAVTIWSSDRRGGQPRGPSPVAAQGSGSSGMMPVAYREAQQLRSQAYDGALSPDQLALLSRLTREDAEALYFASILLDQLAASGQPDGDALQEVRRAAEYEGLVDRLARTQERLDVADRPVVLAAQALLYSLVRAPLEERGAQELREMAAGNDLAATLRAISDRRLVPQSL